MNNKREQDYTVHVAHKMNIDTYEYLLPNRSFANIKYDTDGIDEEIKSLNLEVYDLKTRCFSEYRRLNENEDATKNDELTLARDETEKEIYELVTSIYGE